MNYLFQREYGAIISTYDQLITVIKGNGVEVDFPIELILDLHKRSPGYVFKLMHTHPPEMDDLSERDIKTLKTLAFTFYPFPIAMSVITSTSLSREGFLVKQATTQTRQIADISKKRKVNKGWFGMRVKEDKEAAEKTE